MSDVLVFDLYKTPYDEATLLHAPLGGTQSAVVETCLALAREVDVALCNAVPEERRAGRLRIMPLRRVPLATFHAAKWIVFVGAARPETLAGLPSRGGGPRIALWAHHDIDQPAVAPLDDPAVVRQLSRVLFASEWQRDRYCARFALERALTAVIGNPYCERAYEQAREVAKQYERPRFIYTSTPFRGLDVLAAAFPRVAERLPDATLSVLSGVELYGSSDNDPYKPLFDRLAATPRVDFLKPCGKLELYRRLAESNVLAYPSTFEETFCVNALEARVMQDALLLTRTGALPEIFPDAEFVVSEGGKPSADEWADFMVREWEAAAARAARGTYAAASAACRQSFSPAAVAARLRTALAV